MHADLLIFGNGEYARCLTEDINNKNSSESFYISLVVPDTISQPITTGCKDTKVIKETDIFLMRNRLINPEFMIGFASSTSVIRRHELFLRVKEELGYRPHTHCAESAIIAKSAHIGEGSYIGKGSIINSFSKIGENTAIFAGAIIEHDCHIGSGVVIGPGAVICGGAIVEDKCFIGAGACVVDHAVIACKSFVKANSLVSRNEQATIQTIRCR